ncbi:SDR family oxidoreductase [Laceyella putida]|uniref:SDR family oxidoreductase n=1 Tax=Laceyella putida TaxID=110101 RepID=A0ABW2RF94_9BACL
MKQKVALVTGGTRGLGQAIAKKLAAEGAIVWVASRSAEFTEETVPRPGEIKEIHLDVTDEESVKKLFAYIMKQHNRLDVLINNAGTAIFKPILETSVDEWNQVIETNVTGLFLCSREAFRIMKLQGGGRIINIASISGYIPLANNGAYGTSKYAVRGFSKILNEEGKEANIRVSVISPGAIRTGIAVDQTGFDPNDMLDPEAVAESVLDIARRPLNTHIDEVKILPPKGVL